MVVELRKRLLERHGMPITGKAMLSALKRPKFFRSALRTARTFQPAFLEGDGYVRVLPLFAAAAGGKRLPGLAREFLREKLPERADASGNVTVSLYAGCMIDFIYPEIGEAIWKVLQKHNVSVLFSQEQACCGAPALYAGDRDTARTLAVENIAALEQGSPDYVVTGCPTCAVMLKKHFSELLQGTPWQERAARLDGKVMDFSEFATKVLNIELSRGAEGTATYHDPCHQARSLGTSECSRELVRQTGMELVEMEDADQCCGFAGSYSVSQPGVSESILNRKIARVRKTGAGVVVTDCPGCIMQIAGGLAKHGSCTEVRHSAQLIADLLE